MSCPMCDDYVDGQKWVDLVVSGKKTPSEAARHFGINTEQVMAHIYDHVVLSHPPPDKKVETPVIESIDFFVHELMEIMTYLKGWSKALLINKASSGKDVETGIKLMRELRLTAESIAEFQGRISLRSKSSTVVSIDNMNAKFLYITNAIREELCPECRIKMLKIIEAAEEMSNTIPRNTQEITSST